MNCSLDDFPLQDNTGKEYRISELVPERSVILAFLGVGEEPTEHVLNELLASAAHWNRTGAGMIMVLREPGELKNAALHRVLENLSRIELYYDKEESCERAAARMQVEADKLPVLILLEKGLTGVYACAGYNAGSVELMLKFLDTAANYKEVNK